MTNMATPNFGRGFCDHHYYIFSLSALSLGVKKNNFKDLHQFQFSSSKLRLLRVGVHEIDNLWSTSPTDDQIKFGEDQPVNFLEADTCEMDNG